MGVRPETVSRWEPEREPMGVVSERLLRLMSLRTRPLETYPNERLAQVAKDAPNRCTSDYAATSEAGTLFPNSEPRLMYATTT